MLRRSTERSLGISSENKEHYLAINEEGDHVSLYELEMRRTIFIHDLIPIYGERLSYFIAGPPGCGKSTTAAAILSLFPKMPIYFFSDVKEDRAFEGIKIRRMKMEASLIKELTPEMLSKEGECWVVFDDIDKIRDKNLSNAVISLMENIVANGRSHGGHNIHVIVTSHSLTDYRKTKYMIENCKYWVIFPSQTVGSQLKRLLSKMDLERMNFKKYERLFVHQSSPSFVVTELFITLLN